MAAENQRALRERRRKVGLVELTGVWIRSEDRERARDLLRPLEDLARAQLLRRPPPQRTDYSDLPLFDPDKTDSDPDTSP